MAVQQPQVRWASPTWVGQQPLYEAEQGWRPQLMAGQVGPMYQGLLVQEQREPPQGRRLTQLCLEGAQQVWRWQLQGQGDVQGQAQLCAAWAVAESRVRVEGLVVPPCLLHHLSEGSSRGTI